MNTLGISSYSIALQWQDSTVIFKWKKILHTDNNDIFILFFILLLEITIFYQNCCVYRYYNYFLEMIYALTFIATLLLQYKISIHNLSGVLAWVFSINSDKMSCWTVYCGSYSTTHTLRINYSTHIWNYLVKAGIFNNLPETYFIQQKRIGCGIKHDITLSYNPIGIILY